MEPANRSLFTDDSAARDAAWVRQTLAGDTDAFGQLVRAYERSAVAMAYRLLSHVDDAQEVVQDAFWKAFRSLDRLQEPERFGPWLFRIVRNLSLNARRGRAIRRTLSLDDSDEETSPPEVEGVTPGPADWAEGREMGERLQAALERLPEKQRLALVLFTLEGWPQKDIAEVLECSLETVKWNVFQARRKLRDMLSENAE